MGAYKSQLSYRDGVGQPVIYFCDTIAELPATGLLTGADIAFCHEDKCWYVATSTTQMGKAATSHSHTAAQLASGTPDGTKFLRDDLSWADPPSGPGGGPHATNHQNGGSDEISVAGLSGLLADAQTPLAHSHPIGEVTDLQTTLDGKASTSHSHGISDVTSLQASLDSKAASSHSHAIGEVTNLQTALDGKSATGHGHAIADVTNLQTTLDGKAASSHAHAIADVTNLQATLDGKAASAHNHNATDINAGTVPTARLGSGTANSSTYLRGDQTWATPAGGSSTPQFQLIVIANPITYTNAAAGGTEPAGQQSRVQVDLRGAVNAVGQCLFSVIPHAASGKLHFQYSTDGGSNWNTLLDMGTGGYSANVLKVSAATAVPAGAKIVNALIRVIVHGDGVVDPICQKACLMFQPA